MDKVNRTSVLKYVKELLFISQDKEIALIQEMTYKMQMRDLDIDPSDTCSTVSLIILCCNTTPLPFTMVNRDFSVESVMFRPDEQLMNMSKNLRKIMRNGVKNGKIRIM